MLCFVLCRVTPRIASAAAGESFSSNGIFNCEVRLGFYRLLHRRCRYNEYCTSMFGYEVESLGLRDVEGSEQRNENKHLLSIVQRIDARQHQQHNNENINDKEKLISSMGIDKICFI